MKSEASIDIEAPIQRVFEFTTASVAEWSSLVVLWSASDVVMLEH